MTKFLGGLVVLCLSVVLPLTFSASWFVVLLWALIGIALAVLIFFSRPPLWRRFPWTIRRKDPELDEALSKILSNYVLRHDLQAALRRLEDNPAEPTVPELRAFAGNLAQRLRDARHDIMAARVEVHLPDNADRAAIRGRRGEIHRELVRALLWDDFS